MNYLIFIFQLILTLKGIKYANSTNYKDLIEKAKDFFTRTALTKCPEFLVKKENYQIVNITKYKHIKVIETFGNNETETSGMVTRDDVNKQFVISLRGAHTRKNDQFSLNFKLVLWKEDKTNKTLIHNGYETATNSILDDIISIISALKLTEPTYTIALTGLSYGAPVSTVLSIILLNRKILKSNELQLFTYGGPRIGNKYLKEMANKLNLNFWRVYNEKDTIPFAFPIKLGFLHFGNTITMNENYESKICIETHLESCDFEKLYQNPMDNPFHLIYWNQHYNCITPDDN